METETLTLGSLSRDEKSLLLFLEARAVDHGGTVDTIHMNAEDMQIAERWHGSDFIRFGRIAMKYQADVRASHWVVMSDKAIAMAHEERRARALRRWKRRTWLTTEEKRAVRHDPG